MPKSLRFKQSKLITVLLSIISFCQLCIVQPARAQENGFRITVNGKPLTGMYTAPEKRGQRLFLPAAAIARLLNDQLSVDPQKGIVFLRRQNGVSAEYNERQRQVKENGSITLALPNLESLVIQPNEELLLLPIEIIIVLFNVSVQIDGTKQEIRIKRNFIQERAVTTTVKAEAGFELYQADYNFLVNSQDSNINQILMINAAGRIADSEFSLKLNSSGVTGKRSFWQPSSGNLIVKRPNGQQFMAGDISSNTNLLLIQERMRGINFSAPAFNGRFSFFGGQASSVAPKYVDDIQIRTNLNDTLILGGTFNSRDFKFPSTPDTSLETSAGGLFFRSKQGSSGIILTGGALYSKRNAFLRTDLAIGSFSNRQTDKNIDRVEQQLGFAADTSGNIRLSDRFSLHGQLRLVTAGFKSPLRHQNYPQATMAGGFSWRPLLWLSGGFNLSVQKRTDRTPTESRSFSTTINIAARNRSLPTVYLSHLQISGTQLRSGAVTVINASRDFSRWQLFTNLTRIKMLGPATTTIQTGVRLRSFAGGSLQATQSFGSKGSYGGNFDWRSNELFAQRLSLSAGIGYNLINSKMTFNERVTASIRLPRRTSLQFNYVQSSSNRQFGISLQGSIFAPRRGKDFNLSSERKLEKLSSVSGQVYQDIDGNGEFDVGIDKPQQEVTLRLERGQTVTTDRNGQFSFVNILSGEHKITLDPMTIRADLTLLDGQEIKLTLLPSRITKVDFRLVRTGQATGTVWFDKNENNQQDGDEKLLAGVRVIAGNGHDTLTDLNGAFTIGDLAPGDYVLFIDEKTLPENTKLASSTLNIIIKAGARTSNIRLPIVSNPPIIKRFGV